MINAYDITYGLGLGLSAPIWLIAPKARRKVFKALRERMGRDAEAASPNGQAPAAARPVAPGPAVLIHAVSLGELNAARALVKSLTSARPDLRIILSTTTETGYARGRELYASDPRVTLIHYPLDFSPAIERVLDGLWPSVVVLMELEVWPNFVAHCVRRNIPVLLINGRLTESSFRNYRRFRPLLAPTFRRLGLVCAQDQTYADRFVQLGTPPDRVRVTGTMKFDTAQIVEHVEGVADLAAAVGLKPGEEPVWVCGSTGPGEEQIVLDCYREMLAAHPRLRLVIVPRHPERFDEVAGLIQARRVSLVRRSSPQSAIGDRQSAIVLGDTMGELRKFYSLANVVFVGRSLVNLGPRQHGSDMIEPAALAKPVVVGPFTHNFADAMSKLREENAVRIVPDGAGLRGAVSDILNNPASATAMGRRAQEVVRREQGATARHAEAILAALPPARSTETT
jgi:3-deoxy-D-manno-octulosonic-acid transferase